MAWELSFLKTIFPIKLYKPRPFKFCTERSPLQVGVVLVIHVPQNDHTVVRHSSTLCLSLYTTVGIQIIMEAKTSVMI